MSIRWEGESKSFVLTGEDSLSNYSISTSTFVSKMLNIETVKEAISELNTAITNSYPPNADPTVTDKNDISWIYFVAPPLIIIVFVICFFIFIKMFKRKKR